MKKEIFEMHDGIPIWKHLMKNGKEHKTSLKGTDYGKLAEMIGKRELRKLLWYDNLLGKLFPDITVISINRIIKKTRRSKEYGDYTLEVCYRNKNNTGYGKKVVIYEIKHGKVEISQQQIRRYSNYILDPAAYFRKADEVKVIFMFFTTIDTTTASATYNFCEFNPELARKIVNAIPKQYKIDDNANLFALMDENLSSGKYERLLFDENRFVDFDAVL